MSCSSASGPPSVAIRRQRVKTTVRADTGALAQGRVSLRLARKARPSSASPRQIIGNLPKYSWLYPFRHPVCPRVHLRITQVQWLRSAEHRYCRRRCSSNGRHLRHLETLNESDGTVTDDE